MNKSTFVKSLCNWSAVVAALLAFCCLPGCGPDGCNDIKVMIERMAGDDAELPNSVTASDFDTVTVTINDVDFTFVKCPRCDEFDIPINFNRMRTASIDQDFYIMDSELTVAQYEALKSIDSSLPEASEFNKNCQRSERNNPQIEHKNKPLHGIIPLSDKNSKEGLRYAKLICEALNKALNSSSAKFDIDIPGVKNVQIPTATQWYYAAVAVNDPSQIGEYRHFGTVFGRDYAHCDCLKEILLVSKGYQTLEEIQKSYMEKYWQMIWDENRLLNEPFSAKPNQMVEILLNGSSLQISDDREDVNRIVSEIPLTYLRCLLYDNESTNEHYLFDPSFSNAKEGELPNNWGVYDVRSNVSEVVLDPVMSNGFSIMGGHNGIVVSQEDNWKQYLLWKKTLPSELDQYNMPGLRLIFTVDSTGDEVAMRGDNHSVSQKSWFSSPVGLLIIMLCISAVYSCIKRRLN